MDTQATFISEGRLAIRGRCGGSGWGGKWIKVLAVTAAVVFVRGVSAGVILPGVISSQLDAGLKGEILIEELNCVACHAGEASVAMGSKKAPRLGDVGSRVNRADEAWDNDAGCSGEFRGGGKEAGGAVDHAFSGFVEGESFFIIGSGSGRCGGGAEAFPFARMCGLSLAEG